MCVNPDSSYATDLSVSAWLLTDMVVHLPILMEFDGWQVQDFVYNSNYSLPSCVLWPCDVRPNVIDEFLFYICQEKHFKGHSPICNCSVPVDSRETLLFSPWANLHTKARGWENLERIGESSLL